MLGLVDTHVLVQKEQVRHYLKFYFVSNKKNSEKSPKITLVIFVLWSFKVPWNGPNLIFIDQK